MFSSLAQTNFRDFICWLIACLGVCFLGVELGLGVSIGLSLFLYILETAFPHLAILGRVDKTDLAASTKQFAGTARAVPGVLALRLDAPLYFGNVQYLEDKIDAFLEEAEINACEGKCEWMLL
jgi:sulfate transporter 4